MVNKIISGGQTGTDRAALDAAIKVGLPHGGWVPKGRLAEDGPLPKKYQLQEMPTSSYPERTRQNVVDSDGTLILSHGVLTGGSKLTEVLAERHNKPCLHVDLNETDSFEAADRILQWVKENHLMILNVAGPKASKDPEIYEVVLDIIEILYHLALHAENIVAIRESEMPKTVDVAVDMLIEHMSLKNKSDLAKLSQDELGNLRLSISIYIRDVFRLDSGNGDLLESCREIAGDRNLQHSQAPEVILDELWKRLFKIH